MQPQAQPTRSLLSCIVVLVLLWQSAICPTLAARCSISKASFVGTPTQTQVGYGYDFNGAQTRVTTQTASGNDSDGYEWDFEGRLTRVDKDATHATSFSYDAGGNRIQTQTRSGATLTKANYLVDENTSYAQVLEERDASGTLSARYVYGQGYGPIWMHRVQKNSAGVSEVRDRYLLADGHGSVRQLITESGVVTDSYFYDAWGNALAGGSGNTVNPYRYNGQQTDAATGGYYLRARYYSPGSGRFLSHDPVMGSSQDPITQHRYLYAGDDPVNNADPGGMVFGGLGELGIVQAIQGAWRASQTPEVKVGAALITTLNTNFMVAGAVSRGLSKHMANRGVVPDGLSADWGVEAVSSGSLSFTLGVGIYMDTLNSPSAESMGISASSGFQVTPFKLGKGWSTGLLDVLQPSGLGSLFRGGVTVSGIYNVTDGDVKGAVAGFDWGTNLPLAAALVWVGTEQRISSLQYLGIAMGMAHANTISLGASAKDNNYLDTSATTEANEPISIGISAETGAEQWNASISRANAWSLNDFADEATKVAALSYGRQLYRLHQTAQNIEESQG